MMAAALSTLCPILAVVAATCAAYGRAWRLPAVLALAALGVAILARAAETSTIVPTPPPAKVHADRMNFGDHAPPEVRR